MKETFFILNIIFSTLIFAQNSKSVNVYKNGYNDLINYVPKSYKKDSIYKPESRFLQTELNTIGSLNTYYGFKNEFKLSENDKKWLESRIKYIANALYHDGKRILISCFGGYSDCLDGMFDTIRLNNKEIAHLKFCYTCTDYRDPKFVEIFNNSMYSLMEIEPLNFKTPFFYGEFKGIGKANNEMKLILTKDREFKFWKRKGGHGSDFTQGYWKNKNDTLILNSKILTKIDSLTYTLSSTKWIEFKDLKLRLKKEKLIEIKNRKWKFKKTDK